jgi:hypothetical protein
MNIARQFAEEWNSFKKIENNADDDQNNARQNDEFCQWLKV